MDHHEHHIDVDPPSYIAKGGGGELRISGGDNGRGDGLTSKNSSTELYWHTLAHIKTQHPSILWLTLLIRLRLLLFLVSNSMRISVPCIIIPCRKKKAAREEGPGFDGELNNFQAPQLSYLAKLVSILLFGPPAVYCKPLLMTRNAVTRLALHFQFSVSYLCIIYRSIGTVCDHQTV